MKKLCMDRKWFYLITFLIICEKALASYNGSVYVDKNGNRQYDKGEQPLAKVSVSDGLNVVQTDTEGRFELPGHAKAKFVFITIPSGYRAFTYYQRIQSEQTSYDFGLQEIKSKVVQKDGTHRFIHISDTHMFDEYRTASDGYALSAEHLREYVENENIAFVIHTGDVAREGFASYKDFLNNENMPTSQMFYCVGNHDLGEGNYGEESFEKYFGPTYYSFDVGNIHYIVTPMAHGDGKPTYTNESIGEWLKNDLKYVPEGKPVIAFNHSVMSADGHFRFGSEKNGYIDLSDYNLKAWIYGHWHHDRMYYHDNSNVLMICSPGNIRGSYDHSPSSFRVLTVNSKGDLKSDIRYPYIYNSLQIASIDNGKATIMSSGSVPLSVNTYSAVSPTKKVSYCCYSQGKPCGKESLLKQQTDFSWYAEIKLPEYLNGQLVTVKVTSEFANGEVAKKNVTFRYEKTKPVSIKLGADWTNFLQTSAHVPLRHKGFRSPLQLAWVQNVGANIYFTSPLVYEGNVYIASMDDNEKGKASIICIDARQGTIRWKYPLRHSVRSSIAAAEGCVFAQDVNGWLYAVNAETGKLIWEKDLRMNKQVPLNDGLVTNGKILYAGTGRTLSAFQAKSGKLIWKNKDWDTAHGTVSTFSVQDSVIIGHAFWEATYANDANTGQKLWSKKIGFGSPVAIYNGFAYYISNTDNSISIVEAKTGKRIVRKSFDFALHNLSVPLVTDKEIIFGTAEEGVIAVDRETLEEKWRFRTGRAMIYTVPTLGDPASPVECSPVLAGDVVYIGASDGYLYGLDRETGRMLWKHTMGAPVLGSVAVSGNALFAVDFSGNVYCFASGL